MGKHKQISCEICSKAMRSDNLSRHMKKHADLSSEDSKQLCKDIKSSKDETSIYSEKPKDRHSGGMDELHKPLTVGVDKIQLKNTLLINNHEYKQKLESGKAIY